MLNPNFALLNLSYVNFLTFDISILIFKIKIEIMQVDRLTHYYSSYHIPWSCDTFRHSYATKYTNNNLTLLHFLFAKTY